MKSLSMSYIFWVPSLFGIAGLHRIYLGKIGTGLLYMFTGGLFGIGTIYDALTMSAQVEEANREEAYRQALGGGYAGGYQRVVVTESFGPGATNQGSRGSYTQSRPTSIEHAIFSLAQKNGGSVSPAQLALDANIGADEARNHLESMVDRGHAELRVRKTGAIAYIFPEFLKPDVANQFESLT